MKQAFPVLFGLIFSLFTSHIYSEPTNSLHAPKQSNIIQKTAVIMGTDVGILIASDNSDNALRAIEAGFTEMRRVENLLTDWRDSEFETINQLAGIRPVRVSKETFMLIQEAIRLSKITSGAFDISYASVGKLWGFESDSPKLPSHQSIVDALKSVGYQNINLNPDDHSVYLPTQGMRIGLGGIAKGYAVDRAVGVLRDMGFINFAVNAGGDLTVKGSNAENLWQVAIKHPRELDKNLAILPISNGTVVTSGDSERYFEIEGTRYSHIFDPRTGYPAQGTQSVTIVAKKAYVADALATACFVLGAKRGIALIETLDHVEGLIVDSAGNVHLSTGLKQEKPGLHTL